MYGHTQFDGNAAFSGGGFMPSQATQSPDAGFSTAQRREKQALFPLTVKQISQACESSDDKANITINGIEVYNVKMVGMLFEKAERVTDVSFLLDDGTGRFPCHRWVNEPIDAKEMEQLGDGVYVKVHGHLKAFQGKKQLVVYSVRPITDYNEIAYHFAECMYVHSYNAKVRKMQEIPQVPGHMTNSAMNTPSKGTPSNNFSVHYRTDGVKGIDKFVLDYLQQPSCIVREKGVNRSELVQQLNVPEQKILQAIEALESEGLVYSTIDEFHYKSTANG
ncbi:hypothetical protein ACS0TY_016037 [Phlomoides rotata]